MTIATRQRWHNDLADHLEAIVRLLRRGDEAEETEGEAVAEHPAPEDAVVVAKRVHPQLGEAQERVLAQVAAAHPEGISAGDVARAIETSSPNAHLTLVSLVRQRLVRKDESSHPQRYYLGQRILSELT